MDASAMWKKNSARKLRWGRGSGLRIARNEELK